MYRFDIREISKEDTLKMIQKYHYSNTLPTINNLSSAVVKTTDKTMKITYTLTEETE